MRTPGGSSRGAQALRTALARAGLYDLDENDHQAVEQLGALLDDTTIARLADWLERTRTAALRLASPPRPAYRRPRPDNQPQHS
ncbi:hypothetical protein ACW14Y_42525 (plasmid) [Kitasatospora sp. cg17-2]